MTRCHHARPRRRGAALLLVLVAMAVSVVLAAAFLDSRGGSVPMADGLSSASRARHAANSGLDLALATIRSDPRWLAMPRMDASADEFQLDGAELRIELRDVETDAEPTEQTRVLAVNAIANVDGVEIGSNTVISIPPKDPALDLEFSEVALLAREEIRLEGESVLVPWGSNLAEFGLSDPLLFGTLDGDPDAVHIGGSAVAVDGVKLSVDARAGNTGASRGGEHLLSEDLPPLSAPRIDEPTAEATGDVTLSGEHSGDIDAANIRITARSGLRITGDSIIRSRGTLSIEPGAAIRIESGCVVLEAEQRMIMQEARIEKAAGATLLLVARERLDIRDSVITPEGITIEADGSTPYSDAFQQLCIVDRGEGQPEIRIEGDSRMMVGINALQSNIRMRDTAVLFGRMTARRIVLDDRAAVFARPSTGEFIGLTAPSGPHRDSEGRLVDVVRCPDRTAPENLLNLAELLETTVIAAGDAYVPAAEIQLDVMAESASALNEAESRSQVRRSGRSGRLERRDMLVEAHSAPPARSRRSWSRPHRGGHR